MNQIKIECVLLLQDAVALLRAGDIDQAVKSFFLFRKIFSYNRFKLKFEWQYDTFE